VIPRIVHQVWKDETIPLKWRAAVESVKRYHPGWRYELWTDVRASRHIAEHHPKLAPIYEGFSRNIMRADVIRYALMHDFGGLYCDMDYEFLRPYDYHGTPLVLCLERDMAAGDDHYAVANFIFASEPGHPLWRDIIDDLIAHPPVVTQVNDIVPATGPGLVTRTFMAGRSHYEPCRLTARPVFNPYRARGMNEHAVLRNGGVAYGFHHGSGSWKERLSWPNLRRKLGFKKR
jgi:mannosyltransferase OCH1-like enzyme